MFSGTQAPFSSRSKNCPSSQLKIPGRSEVVDDVAGVHVPVASIWFVNLGAWSDEDADYARRPDEPFVVGQCSISIERALAARERLSTIQLFPSSGRLGRADILMGNDHDTCLVDGVEDDADETGRAIWIRGRNPPVQLWSNKDLTRVRESIGEIIGIISDVPDPLRHSGKVDD